jgi:hypothetical protein
MTASMSRALASLILLAAVQSIVSAGPIEFDPATMMRADEVRPGMKGTGKSVFRGVEVEQFQFEVVGVLEKAILGGDIILCQIVDGPPMERNAGVIGGMSGSPCYIRGRLLGALAYGWFWQKEAMFGIQSIENMLEATRGHDAQVEAATSASKWLAREPLHVGRRTVTAAVLASPDSGAGFADAHTIALQPMMPPVTCSGMGPQAMKLISDALEPHGLTIMSGPGSKRDPVDVTLEPGSAAGVRLMGGDFEISSVGTVTHVEGDQLLAFGHPLMQLGRTSIPICTAWIHDIMPSIQRSSKMGSGMVDVGTMFSDSPWSIAGRLGSVPRTIPAQLRMVDRGRNVTKEFHVEACDQPGLTSLLLSSALVAAAEATFSTGYEGTARVHYKITGQKGNTVERTNSFYFQQSALADLVSEVGFPMYLLEENRFRPQNIASVEVTAEFEERDKTAMIERVYAAENVAEAGKPLHLRVVIRPDAGEPVEKTISLDVPIDTPKGTLRVAVAGGQAASALRSRLRLMMPTFASLDSFISFYEAMEQNTDLVVLAAVPRVGVIAGDTVLMRLPGALEGLIINSPRTDLYGGNTELSHTEASPWVLYGVEYMAIPTADRKGAKGTQPKRPTGPETEHSTEIIGAMPPGAVAPITMLWAADAFPEPVARHLRRAAEDSQIPPPAPPRPEDLRLPTANDDDEEKQDTEDTKVVAAEPPPAAEEPSTDGKLTARQPKVWTHTTAAQFLEGSPTGVAVRSDGVVMLAPHVQQFDSPLEFYALSSAADGDGNVYIGTGGEGRIYRIGADAQVTLLADLDCFAVTALLWDEASERLLAATAPGGRVHQVCADGTVRLHSELPADYLWSMGRDPDGKLLVGTGADGKLFELEGPGKFREVCNLAQAHIMCMAADDQYAYLGTAGQGVVYRLGGEGALTALFDAGDKDITDIAIAEPSENGPGLYLATASQSLGGGVYQVFENGQTVTLYEDGSVPVYSLAWLEGALYAGTGGDGKLLSIIDPKRHSVAHQSDNATVTCLQPVNGHQMIVGTSNLLSVLKLDATRPLEGTLESPVLDAERSAQWGRIHLEGQFDGQGSVRLSTRSGGSSDPADRSWSPWRGALEQAGSALAQSPADRYLQYRLDLASREPGDIAEVSRVSISYMPANREPTVSVSKPSEADVISGSYTVTWEATDPDEDTLVTSVQYQKIGCSEWERLASTEDKSYEWDTSGVESGRYRLQVEVSDKVSNPVQPRSAVATVELVTVDNDAPSIWVDTVEAQDGLLYVSGVAADDASRVAEVCYLYEDRWYAARPADGMYDSRHERFEFTIPLPRRKTNITVRAEDAGGTEAKIVVTWPDSMKPAAKG